MASKSAIKCRGLEWNTSQFR